MNVKSEMAIRRFERASGIINEILQGACERGHTTWLEEIRIKGLSQQRIDAMFEIAYWEGL